MPTPTYTPLATVTLGSSASSVTFSSIPATYRDLVIVLSGRSNGGGAFNTGMRFNNDTGSNYSNVFMLGDGSSASSGSSTTTRQDISFYSSVQGDVIGHIMDYSATDKHKTSLVRYNNQAAVTVARTFRWANTSAITSINFYNGSANGETFASGSTFSLYGVIA
jgi:hypothetical protein